MAMGEGPECPVCWEVFSSTGNTPHALWCGHSLCSACVMGIPSCVFTRIPSFPIVLPFVISCPLCQWYTPRLDWHGDLRYPCKNFSLVWLLESMRPPQRCISSDKPFAGSSVDITARTRKVLDPPIAKWEVDRDSGGGSENSDWAAVQPATGTSQSDAFSSTAILFLIITMVAAVLRVLPRVGCTYSPNVGLDIGLERLIIQASKSWNLWSDLC